MNDKAVEVTIVDRNGRRVSFALEPGMSVAIIGTDGTGKTTAARMFAEHLRASGIVCQQHHWYRWYQALFFVPFAVAINRRRKRAVKIFDRTIFDNVATWLIRTRARGDWGTTTKAIRALGPHFDVTIFLVAAPEIIVRRRPDIKIGDAEFATSIYNEIGTALGFTALEQISIVDRTPTV